MNGLDQDQQQVLENPNGARVILAGPGSGKTTTLVALYRSLLDAGVSPSSIRCVTFSKEAANTIERRIGAQAKDVFSTFHSLGYEICTNLKGFQPVDLELRHRLMMKLIKKWNLNYKDINNFISYMRHHLISPQDAEASGEWGYSAVKAYAEYEATRLRENWIDFDSMLCDAVIALNIPENRAKWQFRYLIVDEAQDTDTCHPPGTMIRKIISNESRYGRFRTRDVPIESLRNGDRVVSWRRKSAQLIHRRAQAISVTKREFNGNLIEIACGSKKTKVTPDHQLYVSMNGTGEDCYLVYLMYRAKFGFRVGQCALRYCKLTKKYRKSLGGLGHRFNEERAEKGWILRVEKNKIDSQTWEQIISCNYGIPYATYGDRVACSRQLRGTVAQAAAIFTNTAGRGSQCLSDYGLDFRFPLFVRSETRKRRAISKRYFITQACNLLPRIMSVPSTNPQEKEQITAIRKIPYTGSVYSLNVPKYHTYVADGIVVKNCQWKLMQQLSEQHGNITVVGDPNQCIFSFRGAQPENITNFRKWFPSGRYLYLGNNYRSTPAIVRFVKDNAPEKTPLTDKMIAIRSEAGQEIELKMYWKEDDEAAAAVSLSQSDPLQTIILTRTNRMVGGLERFCNQQNIRYHLLGKSGFWKQNEIHKAIEKLKEYANMPAETALNLALPQIEQHYAVDDRTERDNDALENLQTLRVIAKDFKTTREFTVYANKMMHRRNDPRGVTISTIHQAKGGEWKNVFLIGCRADMIPHIKGDEREEKRIYFVAVSRAIDRLRISWAGTPSPYLRRYLPEDVLDALREKADEVDHIGTQTKLFS